MISRLRIAIRTYRIQNPRFFLIVLSILIGLILGFVAVTLKNIVHLILNQLFSVSLQVHHQILFFVLPAIGILLSVFFIKYFVNDDISHGVSKVLQAISKKQSRIKFHNTYSSLVTSTFTVGFGGSVGLEAPIVYTGAAIGSNIASAFHQNYKATTLLLACGSAAAVAGIFKAPIAGTVFALEVLMIDLSMWSIIPLLLSSVAATMVSYFMMGSGVAFDFSLFEVFSKRNIPFYIILGLFTGLVSVYFMRQVGFFEKLIKKVHNVYFRIAIGGLIVGLLIYLMPPLFGEGYKTLQIIQGNNPSQIIDLIPFSSISTDFTIILVFLFVIILFKGIAVAFTLGSGGVGGVFAPSLFIGGVSGFIVASAINKVLSLQISVKNFSLVGMAGVMAGVMHAPLTSIFLVAEITGGYGLFVPLIITASISYLTVKIFEKDSIYTKGLMDKGEVLTHNKDRNILSMMKIDDLLEVNFIAVDLNDNLRRILHHFKNYDRNIFPVINENQHLIGILSLSEIKDKLFKDELLNSTFVYDYYTDPPALINYTDSFDVILKLFDTTGAWTIPVIKDGKYIGMLSKSTIFKEYRRLLVQMSED